MASNVRNVPRMLEEYLPLVSEEEANDLILSARFNPNDCSAQLHNFSGDAKLRGCVLSREGKYDINNTYSVYIKADCEVKVTHANEVTIAGTMCQNAVIEADSVDEVNIDSDEYTTKLVKLDFKKSTISAVYTISNVEVSNLNTKNLNYLTYNEDSRLTLINSNVNLFVDDSDEAIAEVEVINSKVVLHNGLCKIIGSALVKRLQHYDYPKFLELNKDNLTNIKFSADAYGTIKKDFPKLFKGYNIQKA